MLSQKKSQLILPNYLPAVRVSYISPFTAAAVFHWSLFQEVLKCFPILKSGRITRTRRIFNILFCSLRRAHGKRRMLQLTWSHAEALGVEPMAQFAVVTPAKTCHNGARVLVTNQQTWSLSHKKIWAENQFREALSHKQPHSSQILPSYPTSQDTLLKHPKSWMSSFFCPLNSAAL